jgi:hypothetical protein
MFYFIIDFMLSKMMKLDNYGKRMEEYILARNPKTTGDVERLEKEFTEKISRGFMV